MAADADIPSLIDHVIFQPRRLSTDSADLNHTLLLEFCQRSSAQLETFVDGDAKITWAAVTRSLTISKTLYTADGLCASSVKQAITNSIADDFIMLYLAPQNATLILHRKQDEMILQLFETSPRSGDVMSVHGALLQNFPGRSLSIPLERLLDDDFLAELASVLQKLSHEEIDMAVPKKKEDGAMCPDREETVHPMMVTQWLYGILHAFGQLHPTNTITKRLHDDVCRSGTEKPWRRSPFWLSVRVAVQLFLNQSLVADPQHTHFKNWMLLVIAHVGSAAKLPTIPSQVLHALNIKLARRNAKLGALTFENVQQVVGQAIQTIETISKDEWRIIQVQNQKYLKEIPNPAMADAKLLLRNSKKSLKATIDNKHPELKKDKQSFKPPQRRSPLIVPDKLPPETIFNVEKSHMNLTLHEFERWVADHLQHWADATAPDKRICIAIKKLAVAYMAAAKAVYKEIPVLMSIMCLTMMDLWIVLDKFTLLMQPLLHEYKQPFDTKLFHCLLLPFAAQLSRLDSIEAYLNERRKASRPDLPSIFSETVEKSFSVRFFDTQESMKKLCAGIEKKATTARATKRKEFRKTRERYESLIAAANSKPCDNEVNSETGASTHTEARCNRCNNLASAAKLQIKRHEWPLPENAILKKAVVFELVAPVELVSWRDLTWYIAHDLLAGDSGSVQVMKQLLLDREGLGKYGAKSGHRLQFAAKKASDFEPFQKVAINNVESIFGPHSLKWELYDTSKYIRVFKTHLEVSAEGLCRRNAELTGHALVSEFINSTKQSQNYVLAQQIQCPQEGDLHEFVAFGSLRAGGRLQWMNLLRELKAGNMRFGNSTTRMLVQHLAWQAGAPTEDSIYRAAHDILADRAFGSALTATVTHLTANIQANWKEIDLLFNLLLILQRLLSITPHAEIRQLCIDGVRLIRQTALGWIVDLTRAKDKSQVGCISEIDTLNASHRAWRCALLCRQSWSVDDTQINLLLTHDTDLEEWVQSTMTIYRYSNAQEENPNPLLKEMILQDERICLNVARSLKLQDSHVQAGITAGIGKHISDDRLAGAWTVVKNTSSCWIQNSTVSGRQEVWFDLGTGKLIIGGSDAVRLPEKYLDDPLYKKIFGSRSFDVYRSDKSFFKYASDTAVPSYTLLFGMSEDKQLRIVCQNEEAKFEILRPEIFHSDIPTLIYQDYLPFVDVQNKQVEFRPIESCWETSSSAWKLTFDTNPKYPSILECGKRTLISKDSDLAKRVFEVFDGFESVEFIHIYMTEPKGLSVELPRFDLNFDLTKNGELYCREHLSIVDANQSIGTFIGLQSKLVLRSQGDPMHDGRRILLTPLGTLHIKSSHGHVNVIINTPKLSKVKYVQFRLNEHLWRLDADVDVESHLFKALLHAVTSHHEPDPFTQHTGAYESMIELANTFLRTSDTFSSTSIDLLKQISQLTPQRSWAKPKVEKVQNVRWNRNLNWVAQHDLFAMLVERIVGYNGQLCSFFGRKNACSFEYAGELALIQRSWTACLRFYPAAFQDFVDILSADMPYESRDRESSESVQDVWKMSLQIRTRQFGPVTPASIVAVAKQWKVLEGFDYPFEFTNLAGLTSLSLRDIWPSLLNWCCSMQDRKDFFRTIFVMTALLFAEPARAGHLQNLLCFTTTQSLRILPMPEEKRYELSLGTSVDRAAVRQLVKENCEPVSSKKWTGAPAGWREERIRQDAEKKDEIDEITDHLVANWPKKRVDAFKCRPKYTWVKTELLKPLLEARRKAIVSNMALIGFLEQCEKRLDAMPVPADSAEYPQEVATEVPNTLHKRPRRPVPSIWKLIKSRPLLDLHKFREFKSGLDQSLKPFLDEPMFFDHDAEMLADIDALTDDITSWHTSNHKKEENDYYESLRGSIEALKARLSSGSADLRITDIEELEPQREAVCANLEGLTTLCQDLLKPTTKSQMGLWHVGVWPTFNPVDIVNFLRPPEGRPVPPEWEEVGMIMACEIAGIQRLDRIALLIQENDLFTLRHELNNPAHQAWSIADSPEWLLLELQNDMLIRPTQVMVAHELMSEQGGVLQLGMGEGKTSVITPMLILALAKYDRLVRVIVPRSLASTTVQNLSHTLSGLCGREVYHIPFDRQDRLDQKAATQFRTILESCQQNHGVLVALPESLNSFRLRSIEGLSASNEEFATVPSDIQDWLDTFCWDIIDECDESLSPSKELVYSAGDPKQISGAPGRYLLLIELLSLVKNIAEEASQKCPDGIEYIAKPSGRFPTIRLLNHEGAECFMESILESMVIQDLIDFSLQYRTTDLQEVARQFVSNAAVDSGTERILRQEFQDPHQLDMLFLLRGFIAAGVLTSCLQKRYFVDYGLHRTRTLSAVPYRAKGIPSANTEFSHPEVMLTLTALSYYYNGIQLSDFVDCLGILLKQSEPQEEYARWWAETEIEQVFHEVQNINLDDRLRIEELYGHLQYEKALVDFYLRERVFPKEAREFTSKLPSSAWDLCSWNSKATTCGFSGTMDIKSLLPHSVEWKDLDELAHTDAAVLAALWNAENDGYFVAGNNSSDGGSSTSDMIETVATMASAPDVLIDVGAQILDDNKTVAARWLELRDSKSAAIFFGHNDKVLVLDRHGRCQRFISSPYRSQIESCLLYLDEAHTRGVDFKLPSNFRAAVMLGPRLTKDRFVQACMRMRKLGHGQTIVCIAPPEVDRRITEISDGSPGYLTTRDVVHYTIHETLASNARLQTAWVLKGIAHARRRLAGARFRSSGQASEDRHRYVDGVRERESRPITEMYAVKRSDGLRLPYNLTLQEQQDPVIKDMLVAWDLLTRNRSPVENIAFDEEQERQLMHEKEEQREVERPPCQIHYQSHTSKTINHLVQYGTLPNGYEDDIIPAFKTLEDTTADLTDMENAWFSQLLFATRDFSRTAKLEGGMKGDEFLRPVNWVLRVVNMPTLFLLSPHEANDLLEDIQKSAHVSLAVYTPQIKRFMPSFSQLDVYATNNAKCEPLNEEAALLLDIFAGRLYFETMAKYQKFCEYLGMMDGVRELASDRYQVMEDGFVPPDCRRANDWRSRFEQSPLPMIRAIVGMRRKGYDWSKSHVGRLVAGQPPTEQDFGEIIPAHVNPAEEDEDTEMDD